MRLGQELASDLLRSVSAQLVTIPIDARVAFFQAYMAVLVGGMKGVMGEQFTRASFEFLQQALIDPPAKPKSSLH